MPLLETLLYTWVQSSTIQLCTEAVSLLRSVSNQLQYTCFVRLELPVSFLFVDNLEDGFRLIQSFNMFCDDIHSSSGFCSDFLTDWFSGVLSSFSFYTILVCIYSDTWNYPEVYYFPVISNSYVVLPWKHVNIKWNFKKNYWINKASI